MERPEEADESELWLRLIVKTDIAPPAAVASLSQEAGELTAIFTASLRTARTGRRRPTPPTVPESP